MDLHQILKWVQNLFRYILAVVLISAGVLKLLDNTALFETVAYITWLPVWFKSILIATLPWFEILVAIVLVTKWKFKYVLSLVTVIFAGFLGFSIYGFATGLEGDCGCFGDLAESSFGWGMIIRNAIFFGMAGFLFYKNESDSE